MLTGNTESLEENSTSMTLRPTQFQFVFLGLEAREAAVGKPALKTKVQLNDIEILSSYLTENTVSISRRFSSCCLAK